MPEERLLENAKIPDEVRGYLRAVLDHSGLGSAARLDVLSELVNHFEDGLAAGRTADDLLGEFGDGKLVGALIRQARPDGRLSPRGLGRIGTRIADSGTGTSRDLMLAVRGLRRHPAYAVVAILTLALGIGANTAVFSVINGVLLRPLPYHAAHELVLPVLTNPGENVWDGPVGYGDFLRWRDEKDVFRNVGLWFDWNLNITGEQRPERIKGAVVSYRYFEVFGVAPIVGRFFAPEEHDRGGGKVAVLSEEFWRRSFGENPDVIGTTAILDEEPYEIVGVVPTEAQWPRGAEIWIPLTFGTETPPSRVLESDYIGYHTIARLQPDVPVERASTVVDQIARRAADERPDTRAGFGARLIPLRSSVVGENTPRTLWLLMASVGFVLLIACANVANLALERSLSRRKEISIRAAIGAGRGRSIRPLAYECLLIAVLGGGLGVAVAVWGMDALDALAPAALSQTYGFSVNFRLLVFSFGISLLTGFGFTLVPALLAARLDLRRALTDGSARTGYGTTGRRARSIMSVVQVALSVVLVLGASLTVKSTVGLLQTDPGFREEGILSMKVFLPHYAPGSPKDRQIPQKYQAFTERLETIPGVVSASAVSGLPLSADGLFDNYPIWTDEGGNEPDVANHFANWNIVGTDFFSTLGIPLSRGRVFSPDDRPTGPGVAIINQSFAREMFPNQDPIGKRIRTRPRITESPLEIVGVVGDVRYSDLTDAARNVVYVPQTQTYWRAMAMVVRFEGNPAGRADEVREAIWAVEPSAPVMDVRTMERLAAETLAARRFVTTTVVVFAMLALALAIVGVYGVINVSLRQRYHELGVRKALGAGKSDVYRLLVGQGARLAFVGVLVGLPLGIVLTRLLSGLLFEVRPNDPVVLLTVPLLLGCCAVAAAALPARRAARIDPLEALRVE